MYIYMSARRVRTRLKRLRTFYKGHYDLSRFYLLHHIENLLMMQLGKQIAVPSGRGSLRWSSRQPLGAIGLTRMTSIAMRSSTTDKSPVLEGETKDGPNKGEEQKPPRRCVHSLRKSIVSNM